MAESEYTKAHREMIARCNLRIDIALRIPESAYSSAKQLKQIVDEVERRVNRGEDMGTAIDNILEAGVWNIKSTAAKQN